MELITLAWGYCYPELVIMWPYAWLFLMGALLTLGSIERTLQAGDGKWFVAGISSAIVSATTWYSIQAAAGQNCKLYASFAIGTVLATMLSAKYHEFVHRRDKE